MRRFYFTYSLEGQPFSGGWTMVEADDRRQAAEKFRARHPDRAGLLHCAGVYDEEEFKATRMYYRGNFRAYCREVIR